MTVKQVIYYILSIYYNIPIVRIELHEQNWTTSCTWNKGVNVGHHVGIRGIHLYVRCTLFHHVFCASGDHSPAGRATAKMLGPDRGVQQVLQYRKLLLSAATGCNWGILEPLGGSGSKGTLRYPKQTLSWCGWHIAQAQTQGTVQSS